MIKIIVEIEYQPDPASYDDLGNDLSEQRMLEFDKEQFKSGLVGLEELIEWGEGEAKVTWQVV